MVEMEKYLKTRTRVCGLQRKYTDLNSLRCEEVACIFVILYDWQFFSMNQLTQLLRSCAYKILSSTQDYCVMAPLIIIYYDYLTSLWVNVWHLGRYLLDSSQATISERTKRCDISIDPLTGDIFLLKVKVNASMLLNQ